MKKLSLLIVILFSLILSSCSNRSDKKEAIDYLEQLKQSTKHEIIHIAIGDSVVKGYGSKINFGEVSSDLIQQYTGKPTTFINLGKIGIDSKELYQSLFDQKIKNSISKADLITVNIGGNDLLRAAGLKSIWKAYQVYGKTKKSYESYLKAIILEIHKQNPTLLICIIELYQPLKENDPWYMLSNKILKDWNGQIRDIATVSPLVESIDVNTAFLAQNENVFSDQVHPNEKGHEIIGEMIVLNLHHFKKK